MVVNLVADKVVGCRALIFLFLFAVLRCVTAAAAFVDCGSRASNRRDMHHDRLHIGAAALILNTIFIKTIKWKGYRFYFLTLALYVWHVSSLGCTYLGIVLVTSSFDCGAAGVVWYLIIEFKCISSSL